jgi:hypothetical protein
VNEEEIGTLAKAFLGALNALEVSNVEFVKVSPPANGVVGIQVWRRDEKYPESYAVELPDDA